MVVVVGLTACVPPAACRVNEVPSLPATVTLVESVAVTVKVEELPAAIDVGLAVMATVGAGDVLLMLPLTHPVNSRVSKRPESTKGILRRKDWWMRVFVTMCAFLFLTVDFPNVAIRDHFSYAQVMYWT